MCYLHGPSKFDENISSYRPNSMWVSFVACDTSPMLVPSFNPKFLSNVTTLDFDDDNEDENPSLPTHFLLVSPKQLLSWWAHTTCEAVDVLFSDSRDQC